MTLDQENISELLQGVSFYNLICQATPEIRQKLLSLFQAMPELAKQVTGAALCMNFKHKPSILFFLSGTAEGQQILLLLLKNNSLLANEITGTALCALLDNRAGPLANSSVLGFLSGTPDGPTILWQLLQKNLSLISEITSTALCALRNDQSGSAANSSALSSLANHPNPVGRQILITLVTNNTNIARGITGRDLGAIRDYIPEGDYANASSALLALASTPDGCQILLELLRKNPGISNEISGDDLCKLQANKTGLYAETTPLYFLSGVPGGCQVLSILMKNNPKLIQGITSTALCRLLGRYHGAKTNTSALYWLSTAPGGLDILSTLISKSVKLAKEITGRVLCARLTPQAGEFENVSALYGLSCNNRGPKVLLSLFKVNPRLISTIDGTDLCARRNSRAGDLANTSALDLFAGFPEGLQVLIELIKNNGKLSDIIKVNINNNVLDIKSRLISKDEGQYILRLIEPHVPIENKSRKLAENFFTSGYQLTKILSKYQKNTESSTPAADVVFRRAAALGNLSDLEIIFQSISDINDVDNNPEKHRSALHWACIKKQWACVEFLLNNGAQPKVVDAHGRTPLDYVKNPNMLKKIFTQMSTETTLSEEKKVMIGIVEAIQQSDLEKFKLLMPNLSYMLKATHDPVRLTIGANRVPPPFFNYLVRANFPSGVAWVLSEEFKSICPNIEVPDVNLSDQGLPIVFALIIGNLDTVRVLLQHQARLDGVFAGNETIFHLLVRHAQSTKGVAWLLSKAWRDEFPNLSLPDINALNHEGVSAALLARHHGKDDLTEVFLEHAEINDFNYDNVNFNNHDWIRITAKRLDFFSSVARFKNFYFKGVVIRSRENISAIKSFLNLHAINLRLKNEYLFLSGTFELSRDLVQEFLVQEYGSLFTAYTRQANACEHRFKATEDETEFQIATSLLELALNLGLNSDISADICLKIATYQLRLYKHTKALSYLYRAYALFKMDKRDAETGDTHQLIKQCREQLAMEPQVFADNNGLTIISSGDVDLSPGAVLSGGVFCINGILLRHQGVPEFIKVFLNQRNITFEINDNEVLIQGPITHLRQRDIFELIERNFGNCLDHFLEMSRQCIDYYFQSHVKSELEIASWYLHHALCLSTKTEHQALIFFLFGRISQAKADPYLAISFYQLAKKTSGLLPDYNFPIASQLARSNSTAQAFYSLYKSGLVNSERLKTICLYPDQAKSVRCALESLKRANVLTKDNAADVCANPRNALIIAYELGGKPDINDVIMQDFVSIRKVSRLLLLGSRDEQSNLSWLPTECLAHIAVMVSDGELDEASALNAAMKNLSL